MITSFVKFLKIITLYSVYKKIALKAKNIKGEKKILDSFENEFKSLKLLEKLSTNRFYLNWEDRYPCLSDNTSLTSFDRHYVIHPAWAARVLHKTNPAIHYDISSTLHFGSIISAFIKIQFFDYRPAPLNISNFESNHADLLNLPFENNSISSLSCMHTIEHIGLGRYGDPLDYDGDLKSIEELKRVLAINGDLLVVVPIASESKIYFNAHRVYNAKQFISYFNELELVDFTLIPGSGNDGDLVQSPSDELLSRQNYACGCFWFKKTI